MNDKDYDNWKLATPWDNDDNIEVYNSDLDTYYHHDENVLSEFEEKVEKLAKQLGLYNNEGNAYENAK